MTESAILAAAFADRREAPHEQRDKSDRRPASTDAGGVAGRRSAGSRRAVARAGILIPFLSCSSRCRSQLGRS